MSDTAATTDHVAAPSSPPNLLSPLATAVLDCLCTALDDAGRPVCRCALYMGEAPPPADECDCECAPGVHGQAWVRLVEARPADGSGLPGRCGTGAAGLRARVEVGVFRCTSVPDADGTPPSGADQTADALDAYADAAVLLRVVECCRTLFDRDTIIEGWAPLGPAGGCGGSAVRFVTDLASPT